MFGEVSQNDSLDCEKGLPTDAETCSDDVNDPFIPRNHEFENNSWEKHGAEAQKAKEEKSPLKRILINQEADWDLKKYHWQELEKIQKIEFQVVVIVRLLSERGLKGLR